MSKAAETSSKAGSNPPGQKVTLCKMNRFIALLGQPGNASPAGGYD